MPKIINLIRLVKNFVKICLKFCASNVQSDIKNVSNIITNEDLNTLNNKKFLMRGKLLKTTCGKEHCYKIYKSSVFDQNKNIYGIIPAAENTDDENQTDNQKELFVATLTHDLKNPLQAQIANLKLLTNGTFGNITDAQKQILDLIIESADFMHKMLYSLLYVYKYDSGCVKLEKSMFKIDELIKKCINESSSLAAEKGITFKYSCNFKNLQIFADESQIRRIIVNLINNGIQYSFHDTEINISVYNNEEKVFISVKNISSPITEDMKKRIFNKYVSLKSKNNNGIGLGLYYSRKAAEAHHGSISLHTDKNTNNFLVELPINPEIKNEQNSYLTLT